MATSTPNSASMTCNQAAQKAAQEGKLTCQELDDANKDARANELKPSIAKKGFAVTTAIRKPANGPAKFMKSCSANPEVKKEFKDGYQKPVNQWTRPDCSGGGGYDAQRRNDAETKILDPEMRAGEGGSIMMKTYHQEVGTDGSVCPDEMPCVSCRKSICGAQECGITVTLCNNKNEEVPASELCDGATPKGTGSTTDEFWVNKGFG